MISRFDSDLEAIMLKALEKDPAQRYQSAAELRHDIHCWLEGFPIAAKSVSSLYVLRKIVARHRRTSAIAGLLLITVLAFSYTSYYLRGVARSAQREAEQSAKQWRDAAVQAFHSARQASLLTFLERWHRKDNENAKLLATYLGKGSKEKRIADLLLNQASITENEDAFHKKCSDIPGWLVDFAIGECHLKNGCTEQALEAYKRSYQAIEQLPRGEQPVLDGLLHEQVAARLYHLSVASEPGSGKSTRRQVE
jgi:hypothetical protein